jgi:hypothetical protein
MEERIRKVLEKFVSEHLCKKAGVHDWVYRREGSAVFRKCTRCKKEQGLRIVGSEAVWMSVKDYKDFR